jgi:hypothetical protein
MSGDGEKKKQGMGLKALKNENACKVDRAYTRRVVGIYEDAHFLRNVTCRVGRQN